MPDLRAARAAVLTRWHRDLGDNFTAVLPRVLDDLDAADAQFPLEAITVRRSVPTDAEITAWIEAHPAEFAAWYRKQALKNAFPTAAASLPDITGTPEPAPERIARTTTAPARARKPRGGTTT